MNNTSRLLIMPFLFGTVTMLSSNLKAQESVPSLSGSQEVTQPIKTDASNLTDALVMSISSPAFKNDERIPDKYTCKGLDVNPPLSLSNLPANTRSLALVVYDPEGTVGEWAHWVVYNIPSDMTEIKEKTNPGTEALNDFGNFYYGGPCLSDGKLHRFLFSVYALDILLDSVNEGSTKADLDRAMQGHILSKAELAGIYQNANWE